ncbi:type II toxin-antitoxin system VapB family antitoxin [Methylobacterium brachythecii]|uniref:Antitoxin VapB n=1 Tax=Methylobacterium brachythecii TaxID=1176177 RepID=A0A7W6ANE1_9HYPH|nr:type II toxin-antitoxin system VapB family antitoxin [Methylobacterium brachythecii]MBB3904260.1 antitoxin VapB [Methylobacterium brachythecii]GLS45078.1 hypothetical protein GCM10007884_30670 [Methylobacterium brachythecii]
MPLNIRSEEVNRLADKLASLLKVSKTEAVRIALTNELTLRDKRPSLQERLKPMQEAFAAYPRTGLQADKAIFDEMNGEP